jgi:hypothetical protein
MIHQAPQAERFKQQLRESLQRETLNSRARQDCETFVDEVDEMVTVDARPITLQKRSTISRGGRAEQRPR